MRVIIYLLGCCLTIAACAWAGYWATGLVFTGENYELGSRQIGQFVVAFATGVGGFMAVASLSMKYSRLLARFFSPFEEMRD